MLKYMQPGNKQLKCIVRPPSVGHMVQA